ncbi:MAG: hypothetical protein VX878_12510, partial [Pseudomonadota bacterium]|nr:hypothetical protein [Pseudomonadota bacterium]
MTPDFHRGPDSGRAFNAWQAVAVPQGREVTVSSRLPRRRVLARLALRDGGGQKWRTMATSKRLPPPLPFADQVAIFSRLAEGNPV